MWVSMGHGVIRVVAGTARLAILLQHLRSAIAVLGFGRLHVMEKSVTFERAHFGSAFMLDHDCGWV